MTTLHGGDGQMRCEACEPDMTRWVTCHEGGVWDTTEVPRTANPCLRCGALVVYDMQPSKLVKRGTVWCAEPQQ